MHFTVSKPFKSVRYELVLIASVLNFQSNLVKQMCVKPAIKFYFSSVKVFNLVA